jgi:hypothetical protein
MPRGSAVVAGVAALADKALAGKALVGEVLVEEALLGETFGETLAAFAEAAIAIGAAMGAMGAAEARSWARSGFATVICFEFVLVLAFKEVFTGVFKEACAEACAAAVFVNGLTDTFTLAAGLRVAFDTVLRLAVAATLDAALGAGFATALTIVLATGFVLAFGAAFAIGLADFALAGDAMMNALQVSPRAARSKVETNDFMGIQCSVSTTDNCKKNLKYYATIASCSGCVDVLPAQYFCGIHAMLTQCSRDIHAAVRHSSTIPTASRTK